MTCVEPNALTTVGLVCHARKSDTSSPFGSCHLKLFRLLPLRVDEGFKRISGSARPDAPGAKTPPSFLLFTS